MAQLKGGTYVGGDLIIATDLYANTLKSYVATGTAPMTINSTTLVTNLNADLLDGYHASSAATASTIVAREGNADVWVRFINSSRADENSAAASYLYDTGDGYMRKKSLANVRSELGFGSYLPLAGGIMSGNIGRSTHIAGHLVGSYDNIGDNASKSNPIYSIGSSYVPIDAALSNMYGIGYTTGAATFINATDLGVQPTSGNWGLYVAGDGNARIFLDATAGNGYFLGSLYEAGTALSAKYSPIAGSSSIVTIGTVTSGTWSASTIATNKGGTNLTSFTSGGAVYATSTSVLTTGTLPVTAGGTGVATLSGLAYGNAATAFSAATAAQVVAVISTTAVTNATNATNAGNADTLDTEHASAFVHIAGTETITGAKTFNAGLTIGTSQVINHNSTGSRYKYYVWNGGAYAIGMEDNYTFGGLETAYAMTFQMNNDNARGFWWGDDGHSVAQGAMALTTNGKLTIASAVRVGYGEADTVIPTASQLDVKGGVKTSDGTNACEMKYNTTSKTLDFIFS